MSATPASRSPPILVPTRVVLLGATGSIGRQALDVIQRYPQEFELAGAVAGSRAGALVAAAAGFGPVPLVVVHPDGPLPPGVSVGVEAARRLCGAPGVDVVLVGGGAAAALEPTLAACRAGIRVALATKEVLVMAGEVVTQAARAGGARLVPVDSEHSAIWQCLRGEEPASVARLVLTASGGAFRTWPRAALEQVTAQDAVRHPTWRMGPKITVDCATMMNKGLEVIEAHFLFDVPYPRIDVVVHPESQVHSAVEFVDGLMLAQLGPADMRGPIALALTGGRRLPQVVPPLALAACPPLHFEPVDPERFPALGIARRAGERGGAHPAVLNAANEAAVAAFLAGRLGFTAIVPMVEGVLARFEPPARTSLDTILAADRWARQAVRAQLPAGRAVAAAPQLP